MTNTVNHKFNLLVGQLCVVFIVETMCLAIYVFMKLYLEIYISCFAGKYVTL